MRRQIRRDVRASARISTNGLQTHVINVTAALSADIEQPASDLPLDLPEVQPVPLQIEPEILKSNGVSTLRKCPRCSFKSTILSHFKEHYTRTCSALPKQKTWQCEICKGMFEYRTLQQHLDMYMQKKRKSTNGHEKLSNAEHAVLKTKYKQMKLDLE